ISAVDAALWDQKAHFLELPLCRLLGQKHEALPVYASGGFTSYSPEELSEKFSEWKAEGHNRFKMKIGRNKKEDLQRLEAARKAIGKHQLFVDANGAYIPKEALAIAKEMQQFDVRWFEEPVTSDDPEGMHLVKEQVAAPVEVAAGEYGYTLDDFRSFLEKRAVDVLQADATRCGGITGFLKADALCEAFHVPLSAHCAPALHLHAALSSENIRHAEYFKDHVRLENELFEGCPVAKDGKLWPDLERTGMGLEFRFSDAEKYEIA
ncbi:MAG: enolase C-terminal domain-like protein, partial [Salinimicrobium sp.]